MGLTGLFTKIIVAAVKKPIEDAARVQAIIENAPINILFADAKEFKVQYMNPSSFKTLKTIEQHLPVQVEEIVGKCIDVFHKNPAHQRKVLSDPNNLPLKTQIIVGPETLSLEAAAIRDSEGNYIGPMISWSVITQQLEIETRSNQLASYVENNPSNMITADKDLIIRYINPASKETLKPLEQYLPIKIDDIVGQSVDIFHKDPAHQRKNPIRPQKSAAHSFD